MKDITIKTDTLEILLAAAQLGQEQRQKLLSQSFHEGDPLDRNDQIAYRAEIARCNTAIDEIERKITFAP